jgi:hypothetical protein
LRRCVVASLRRCVVASLCRHVAMSSQNGARSRSTSRRSSPPCGAVTGASSSSGVASSRQVRRPALRRRVVRLGRPPADPGVRWCRSSTRCVPEWWFVASGCVRLQIRWVLVSQPLTIGAFVAGAAGGVRGMVIAYAVACSALVVPSFVVALHGRGSDCETSWARPSLPRSSRRPRWPRRGASEASCRTGPSSPSWCPHGVVCSPVRWSLPCSVRAEALPSVRKPSRPRLGVPGLPARVSAAVRIDDPQWVESDSTDGS